MGDLRRIQKEVLDTNLWCKISSPEWDSSTKFGGMKESQISKTDQQSKMAVIYTKSLAQFQKILMGISSNPDRSPWTKTICSHSDLKLLKKTDDHPIKIYQIVLYCDIKDMIFMFPQKKFQTRMRNKEKVQLQTQNNLFVKTI